MTRQLSDKDRKIREDFWQAIRGFKFTHHVSLIFRLIMLPIYFFLWRMAASSFYYRATDGVWHWVLLPTLIGLGISLIGRFRFQSSAYVALLIWDLLNVALIFSMVFKTSDRVGYYESGGIWAILIYSPLLVAGLTIGACIAIVFMLLLSQSLWKVNHYALEVWESEHLDTQASPSKSLYHLIKDLKDSHNLEEKRRDQRLVYRSFYLLAKFLLFIGAIVLSIMQDLTKIKEFKLIPLVIIAIVFIVQLVLLSEKYGHKSLKIIEGLIVSDACYVFYLFVHFAFSWMNFVYVKLQYDKSRLFYTQVSIPAILLGLGLLALTFSWLWWRSYRKSQQDIAATVVDQALES